MRRGKREIGSFKLDADIVLPGGGSPLLNSWLGIVILIVGVRAPRVAAPLIVAVVRDTHFKCSDLALDGVARIVGNWLTIRSK